MGRRQGRGLAAWAFSSLLFLPSGGSGSKRPDPLGRGPGRSVSTFAAAVLGSVGFSSASALCLWTKHPHSVSQGLPSPLVLFLLEASPGS